MINEPHPTVPANTYTHSGRGGAGNMFRAPATTAPTGVATPAAAAKTSSTKRFYSGRGGAGNAHASVDRPVLSFEEEYASAAAREKHASGHVGRGGAGNVFSASASNGADRRDSASTNGSVRSGFWGRLSSGSR